MSKLDSCDCTWDRSTYNKPWRDPEYLRCLYESDAAPTQKQISQYIGCSVSTVQRYIPDDAQRGGEGLPYEDIALFSGGYDSLVSTHYAMEELDCDVVLHIDTRTALPQNTEFVRHVCETFEWPLEIRTPTKTLTEFAKEYGFPKSQAHSWIYQYLKEHPISHFTTELEIQKPSYYSGVRKDESERRMENVTTERQPAPNGRWWWEAPIADWSKDDIVEYMIDQGLPRSSVVETIGRSGECFCGAFADRFSELLTLEEHYPEHYEWIKSVEQEVQMEIGDDEAYCYWGASGLSSDELTRVMESEDSMDMTLCADCEGGAHRSFGHSQDPTYETVYLAGPRSDGNNPFAWHEVVSSYDETVNWINPFLLNEYDSESEAREHKEQVYATDLDAVRQSDVVLLRRIDGYNLCGASIEAGVAMEHVGIPVIVWNDADTECPLMLEALATEVHDDRRASVQAALSYGRSVVRERTGDTPLVT